MVKFGKPEATWKTGEEENSCGRVGSGGGRTARDEEREEGRKGRREVPRERSYGRVRGREERERDKRQRDGH